MEGDKIFDFEQRTLIFAKRVLHMVNALPKNEVNRVLVRQIVRSASSVGANYREAGDALGDKDFVHRLKIARKEAKETTYWIELIQEQNSLLAKRCDHLRTESIECTKILSAMINTATKKQQRDS